MIDNLAHVTSSDLKDEGDSIVLIETPTRLIGRVDLNEERALQSFVSDAIHAGLVKSAHDISDGGIAVALSEMCYSTLHRPGIGATVKIPQYMDACKDLFGEYSSRILLTTTHASDLVRRAERSALRCTEIGRVGGNHLILHHAGQQVVDVAIEELESVWRRALPKLLS